MSTLVERVKNSWNAFMGRDPTYLPNTYRYSYGGYYGSRPDRTVLSRNNTRSIVNTVYNKIATDIAAINIQHVLLDEAGQFKEIIDDPMNRIFSLQANIDQSSRMFVQNMVMSMFDDGCIALVPVQTDENPMRYPYFMVENARVGKIIEWFPKHVRVNAYNDETGVYQDVILPKAITPIIENPFYSIMNEPNSTAQRLIRVLNQIDRTNEQNSAGKIDLLIQLPYPIKSESKMNLAESRRARLEEQLSNSQHGIGYIDASEKVVQLNRAVENNLWTQAQELLVQLYNQLGLAESIFNGTADEQTMLNYQNSTLDPILTEITLEVKRKWLSKEAIEAGESIKYYRDPFRLIPVGKIADIADKFTRNEIMTSNEMRSVIGLKPSSDPKADELRNANLNHPDEKESDNSGPKFEDAEMEKE